MERLSNANKNAIKGCLIMNALHRIISKYVINPILNSSIDYFKHKLTKMAGGRASFIAISQQQKMSLKKSDKCVWQ